MFVILAEHLSSGKTSWTDIRTSINKPLRLADIEVCGRATGVRASRQDATTWRHVRDALEEAMTAATSLTAHAPGRSDRLQSLPSTTGRPMQSTPHAQSAIPLPMLLRHAKHHLFRPYYHPTSRPVRRTT